MTTTDLKPGDIVEHPEQGYGVVLKNFPGVPTIYFAGEHGYENTTRRFTGWERVETVRPGHVQVRVDDLADELRRYAALGQGPACLESNVMLRVTRALDAQCAESTLPAGEQPTSATVTLYCPDCGEDITDTATVGIEDEGGYYLTFANSETHTCLPAQPDEPTEFGARVTCTRPDGIREKWLRQVDGWWVNEVGGQVMWKHLIGRGIVTIGWDE